MQFSAIGLRLLIPRILIVEMLRLQAVDNDGDEQVQNGKTRQYNEYEEKRPGPGMVSGFWFLVFGAMAA